MTAAVLDASALLALLNSEVGAAEVAEFVAAGARISTVNLSEIAARLTESGMPERQVRVVLQSLELDVVDFDQDVAYATGFMRATTRAAGLSLGDRACLALAQHLGEAAVTADRRWATLGLAIDIKLVR